MSLAVVIPAGFCGKFYKGPGAHWVNDSLGGVAYDIMWCLVLGLCLPRWKAPRIAAVVLTATCVLEFMQLWHPPWLEWMRGYFLGRTILGSTFDWWDFPYYFAGSALGWLWLRIVNRG
jgi:hypothetical protein